MVAYTIDTNIYINALRGYEDAMNLLIDADSLVVPFIVLGELEYGFRAGTQYEENIKKLSYFLLSPNCNVKHSSAETIASYGLIRAQLRKDGLPIPENDVWISAIAMELNIPVATYDSHFRNVTNLEIALLKVDGE